jgi:protocatechuate 3,4-dioxygenase beta subunit
LGLVAALLIKYGASTLLGGDMRIVRSTGCALATAAVVVGAGLTPAAHASTPIGPVHNLRAASNGSSSIKLTWTEPHGVASALVRYARGSHAPTSPAGGTRAGVVHAPRAQLTVGRLQAGTQYAFAVFASDGHGHYATRAIAHAVTGPAPVRDQAPFDTGSSVRLTWTNPKTSTFDATVVRYAAGTATPRSPQQGTGAPLSSPKATHATLTGLAVGTTYSVAIWTRDAHHRYSNVATMRFTTRDEPPADATISGTVTDTGGHPLTGVRVYIETFGSGNHDGTTTDSSGHYSLTVLPGGYYVGFDGALATGGNSDPTGYQGDVLTVEVSPGEAKAGIDAHLGAGAALGGLVTDAAGHPLAGVMPNAVPVMPYVQVTGPSGFLFAFGATAVLPSGTDGRFVIKGLPAAPVRVCLDTTTDTVTGGNSDLVGYVGLCASRATITRVRLARAVPNVALAANPDGLVVGSVTDPAGQPVANTFVSVNPIDPNTQSFPVVGFTRSDGTYRIRAAAGRYHVCADPSANGLPSTAAPTCTPSILTVHRGEIATAHVQLARGAAVAGMVTGPDGKPLADAAVDVESIDLSSAQFALTDAHGQFDMTGLAPGSYTVCFAGGLATSTAPTGLGQKCPKTRYTLRAGLTRLGVDGRLGVGGAISGRITDDLGNPLTNVFVDVESATNDFALISFTETFQQDGSYTIIGLETGAYSVCAVSFDPTGAGSNACYGASPGDPFNGKLVHVRAGETTGGIDMSLATGGSVTVTVQDTHGHPIGGVNVAAVASCNPDTDFCTTLPLFGQNADVAVKGSDTTAVNGTVTLSGLSPGNYAICLFGYYGATLVNDPVTGYTDSCGGTTFDVTVQKQQTTPISRTLGDGGAITGTITDADGNPLSGAQVTVSNAAPTDYFGTTFGDVPIGFGGPVDDTLTDANGRYTIHGVPPGGQTVCVDASAATGGTSRGGYLDSCVGGQTPDTATSVHVDAGTTTFGVDLSLVSGAAVSGTVRNGAGHALVDGEALAFDVSGVPVAGAVFSNTGAYRIARLPAGTYTVCFVAYRYHSQCFNGVAWDDQTGGPPKKAAKIVVAAGTERRRVDATLLR